MDNKIKELRKKKKLTQEELAQKINVTKLTISRWERGERVPKSDKAQQLAKLFGVSISYLLGYTQNNSLEFSQKRKFLFDDKQLNLKKLMEEKGITLEDLAQKTGYSMEVAQYWVDDMPSFTIDELRVLGGFFNVKPSYIIGRSDDFELNDKENTDELKNIFNNLTTPNKEKLLNYARDLQTLQSINSKR
ncbi:XRE family transcriptional regulator [Streptococcus gallolyticus]|uniref:XRE family transcriptional regulator n=1 Tax=Streptococcus gallolyticus TaxID=315405 RepID=UPI00069A9B87|nr:helix-turn-helix transcriptional regulator [Streptococcus gallolyticus]QBX08223.1 DNA-binding protein [Streptococcus satellite phage Javan230]